MFRSGSLRVLFLAVFALVAGLVGYQIGVGSTAAASGATVIVTGGGPGFGFLFFLFFIGILLFAFGGRRRGPWGYGHGAWGPGMSRGPWGGQPRDGGSGTDPRRQWVAAMHRNLHAADVPTAAGATPRGDQPKDTPTA